MVYQEMYYDNGLKFRNTILDNWIDRVWFEKHGWIHKVINRKGTAAFYDLLGADVVKEIHNIYKHERHAKH